MDRTNHRRCFEHSACCAFGKSRDKKWKMEDIIISGISQNPDPCVRNCSRFSKVTDWSRSIQMCIHPSIRLSPSHDGDISILWDSNLAILWSIWVQPKVLQTIKVARYTLTVQIFTTDEEAWFWKRSIYNWRLDQRPVFILRLNFIVKRRCWCLTRTYLRLRCQTRHRSRHLRSQRNQPLFQRINILSTGFYSNFFSCMELWEPI